MKSFGAPSSTTSAPGINPGQTSDPAEVPLIEFLKLDAEATLCRIEGTCQ